MPEGFQRGETVFFPVFVLDGAGAPINIAGGTLTVLVKWRGATRFTLDVGDEIEILDTDPAPGSPHAIATLSPAVSGILPRQVNVPIVQAKFVDSLGDVFLQPDQYLDDVAAASEFNVVIGGVVVVTEGELLGAVVYEGAGLTENLTENTGGGVAFGGSFVLVGFSGDVTYSAVDPTGRVSCLPDGTAISGSVRADYEDSQLAQPVVTATIVLEDRTIEVTSTVDISILNQDNSEEVPFNLRIQNTVIQAGVAGVIVGSFSAEHLNIGEALTYSLTGDGADDSLFTVVTGTRLKAIGALVEGDYAIEWRVTDEFGNFVDKVETITATNFWYLLGDVVDGWAVDPAQGDGVGYTLSAGVVSALHDVLGSAEDLLPTGTGATISSINGVDALQFDGVTATVKKYEGAASAAAATLDGSVPFKNISIHAAFHPDSAATQTIFGLSNAAGAATPEYRMDAMVNGIAVNLTGAGLTTISLSPSAAIAPSNYNAADWAVGGFNDGAFTTAWTGGELSQFQLSQAFLQLAGDLNFDRFVLGGIRAELQPFNGKIGGVAVIADENHTLAGAIEKHRGLIRTYAAPRMLDAALWILYGQSNATLDQTPIIGANIPDYTAYEHRINGLLPFRTGVGPAMGRTCPGIHAGKHFRELTGIVPFFVQAGRSGTPVTPQASFAAGTGGDVFIGVQSALSDSLGRVSWYSEDQGAAGAGGRHDHMLKAKQMFDATPRFNFTHTFVHFLGAEGDALMFATDDVTIPEFRTEIDLLFDTFNIDFGQCTFLVVPVGARGSDLAAAQNNELGHGPIRDEQRAQIAARADTLNVFDHAGEFDPLNFSNDDLVVDGNGYWVSGRKIYDSEVHYHEDFSICIGKTSAYNAAVQLGYIAGSVI